jgi:hypothetical protein
MSQPQLDAQREAHEALGTAVASYGQRVLSDPHILGNLVTDLLPDLPRERSLLVAGAEAGIAAEMTQHVQQEHIDPDTAVQLVARALSERRAIDPAASMWVATEYAQALGYQVRPYAQALSPEAPEAGTASSPTRTVIPGQPWPTPPPSAVPMSPQVPPMPYPPGPQPQGPQAQSWPPQAPPPSSWPSAQPPSGGRPRGGAKRRIMAAAAAAGVVILYLVVAAITHTVPFAKSHAVALPAPTHKPTHKPTLTPTPAPVLAKGVSPLLQLLPQDITDPTTQCQAVKKPYSWSMPGLVSALACSDPDLPNGYVDGYQMNSRASFDAAWRNFNTWWGFNSSGAQTSCPPSSDSAQGLESWHSQDFPTMQDQVLECQMGTGSAPVYVWTLPTQDTFLIAVGGNGSSFKALNSWWGSTNSNPAVMPTGTPSPTTS